MARVFITGSSEGLGLACGRVLAEGGHRVTLHARNEARADDARHALPDAEAVLVGDVSSIEQTRQLAGHANEFERFDAVIHNVGVGHRGTRHVETADGLDRLFAVNVLAPYLLTALLRPPDRLVYLSSNMHRGGDPDFEDLQWERRRWDAAQAYSDSKFLDLALALAVARHWPKIRSNAVNPGWAQTKMGGAGAPDGLEVASATQVWLAVSDDPNAAVTGEYFYHERPSTPSPATRSAELQGRLLEACVQLTGTSLPSL